jgi:hypothetical protein
LVISPCTHHTQPVVISLDKEKERPIGSLIGALADENLKNIAGPKI